MDLKEWWPWYDKIIKTFGYDPSQDQYATDLLSKLLDCIAVPLSQLKILIAGKPVLVFGAGPSLEENIRQLLEYSALDNFVLISADGATSALLEIAKKAPEIVVTDLDGRIGDLFKANAAGALMAVHGHGNNIPLLKRYVPKLGEIVGTTQAEPRPNVYNFGGFTDGDRAVFLSIEMGARIVVLAGMDFGQEIGRYSKRKVRSLEVKRLKLKIGRELLEWLSGMTATPLYNLSTHGEKIVGVNNIASEEIFTVI